LQTRYRGLEKNKSKLVALFALAKLWIARRKIIKSGHVCARKRHSALKKARNAVEMRQKGDL
jgi:hypothetical protein